MPEELKWIAEGPTNQPFSFNGYVINACHFNIKSLDDRRINQNRGISIMVGTMQFSSAKNKNSIYGDMAYYGVIKEIWEFDYRSFQILVFKCDWIESNNRIKVDKLGFTCVNLSKVGHKDDHFILTSQANQVFYVDDQMKSG